MNSGLRVNGCGPMELPEIVVTGTVMPLGGHARQFSNRSKGEVPTHWVPTLRLPSWVTSSTLTSKTTCGAGTSESARKLRADWMMSGVPLTITVSVRGSMLNDVGGITVAN